MTEDSDFKHLVRVRMATTGETYTAARAALRPDPSPPSDPAPPEVLIERLEPDPAGTRLEESEEGFAEDAEGFAEDAAGSAEEEEHNGSSMAGYLEVDASLSVDDLITLASVGVSPSELARLRAARPGCSLDDVISLHTMGVTTDVIAGWQEIDPGLQLNDILGAAAVGLTPETFFAYRENFGDITVDKALGLYTVGVRP